MLQSHSVLSASHYASRLSKDEPAQIQLLTKVQHYLVYAAVLRSPSNSAALLAVVGLSVCGNNYHRI